MTLNIEFLETCHLFFRRVGKMRFDDFKDLAIKPDEPIGIFSRSRILELINFCRENPDYHVISVTKQGIFLNGYTSQAAYYCVGWGEVNPRLAFDCCRRKNKPSDIFNL